MMRRGIRYTIRPHFLSNHIRLAYTTVDLKQKRFDLSNRFFIITTLLVLGVLAFFAGQVFYQYKAFEQQNSNQITVSGEGKIYAKPDVALVDLGVSSQKATVADVTKSNTDKMNAIIAAVKGLGIDEKDIQTTNYNLSPYYNYTAKTGSVFQGYTLDQNIQVKIRDFTKIGDVLSQTTAAGANTAGGLQFTIDNPEQLKEQARAKAIAQAKANAKNLAQESGISLGKLINVFENSNPYPVVYSSAKMMGAGVAESAPVPTIQPGQQEIDVTINLTYQVN